MTRIQKAIREATKAAKYAWRHPNLTPAADGVTAYKAVSRQRKIRAKYKFPKGCLKGA